MTRRRACKVHHWRLESPEAGVTDTGMVNATCLKCGRVKLQPASFEAASSAGKPRTISYGHTPSTPGARLKRIEAKIGGPGALLELRRQGLTVAQIGERISRSPSVTKELIRLARQAAQGGAG